MPNFATVLKDEIARVARKQTRADIQALKKSVAHYRSEIAALKRRLQALEQQVRKQGRATRGEGRAAAAEEGEGPRIRYSARSLAAQRKRLGLSAPALARLLGVSALSVYKWESGATRPRARQIESIAGLRSMGRREAARRLEELAA